MSRQGTLNRRQALGGIGVMIALPWLESFRPARAYAQTDASSQRFLTFFTPNGFNMSRFWPSATGPLTAESMAGTSLQSLGPYADKLLVVQGLDNYAGAAQGDGPGDHARGTSTTLTCVHPLKSESELGIGISIDQVLANHWAGQTRFPSLELGCQGGGNTGSCDSGYSCAYSRNIAWSGPATPLPKETNPRLLFDRLFDGEDPTASAEARLRRRTYKQSIFDFVLEDARSVKQSVSNADGHRLDEYMTGIRELELRLQSAEVENACVPLITRPGATPSLRSEYIDLMSDLMVTAFRCDLTRVISFMSANGGNNTGFPDLGITEGHHELSHHQNDPGNLEKLATIDAWYVDRVSHLMGRLDAIDMGGRTLLDETTLLFTSEVADGNGHHHYNLPVVFGGQVAGAEMGRHLDVGGLDRYDKPIASVFLNIAQHAGAEIDSFGDDGITPLTL